MGVSMQFVIASPWMFLTNRLTQPSDDLAEKDISAKLVSRPKYMDVKVVSKAWRCWQIDRHADPNYQCYRCLDMLIAPVDLEWELTNPSHLCQSLMINTKGFRRVLSHIVAKVL